MNVSDPFHPKEIGCYVPALEGDRPAVQSNDIGTDEHGRLYLIDRAGAGMQFWSTRVSTADSLSSAARRRAIR